MTALLTSVMSSQKEKERLKYEASCVRNNIKLLPHDINYSKTVYTLEDGGIRRPLASVKGVGEKAAAAITACQPFKNQRDFFYKMGSAVNSRAFEALVNSGCMEGWAEKKADLLASFEGLRDKAKKQHKHEEELLDFEEGTLFGGD